MDRTVRRRRGFSSGERAARTRVCIACTRIYLVCAFVLLALLAGCAVYERKSLPAAAQETIDRVTEDIAAGREEKVYAEASDEWRAQVTPDESRAMLGRARERLGRVQSRAMYAGKEQQEGAGGKIPGHSLVVTYQTTFERATGMETFTLLEREGRWLLAGYTVTSDALRQ